MPACAIRRLGEGFELHQRQRLAAPIEEVFAFFAEPENLEALTPDRLQFTVDEVDGPMGEGAEIAYELRLHGLPIRWISRIEAWDPPRGFADVQVTGPYARWEHVHLFVEDWNETVAVDRVSYRLPGGLLGNLVGRWFVERDLGEIFEYRAERLADRFGSP